MSRSISVMVTGSAGRVGGAACAALAAGGHRVRGYDIAPSPAAPESVIGSLTDAGRLREAMTGIETLIHCAAVPDEDDFLARLLPNNVVGVYNVLEAARQAGVKRVMLASTGQVVMGHEGPWPITPEMPYSPRNWYGSAKVFAEVAGQVYAHVHGMSVVVVRLGWCPRDNRHARALATDEVGQDVYLSPADAGRFFRCALETEPDLRYCIVFVTSRPLRRARYDISGAERWFGYTPFDQYPAGTEIFDIDSVCGL